MCNFFYDALMRVFQRVRDVRIFKMCGFMDLCGLMVVKLATYS